MNVLLDTGVWGEAKAERQTDAIPVDRGILVFLPHRQL